MPFKMPTPSWYPAQDQAEKIREFILWFSRYEYALKNGGFHRTNAVDLKPNWITFRAFLAQQPIPQTLEAELDYLRHNPPNVQKSANLAWLPMGFNTDWELLIGALQVVRNNLFHGGKHHNGQVLEPARDQTLIEICQKIMVEILPICPQSIKDAFNGTN